MLITGLSKAAEHKLPKIDKLKAAASIHESAGSSPHVEMNIPAPFEKTFPFTSIPILDDVKSTFESCRANLAKKDYFEAGAEVRQRIIPSEVKVFVDASSSEKSKAVKSIEKAIDAWNTALEGVTKISLEPNRSKSTFIIHWDDPKINYTYSSAGKLTTSYDMYCDRTLNSPATVYCEMMVPTGQDSVKYSEDVRCQTIMHEFGHFFGLDDTMYPGEIMGPVDFDQSSLVLKADEISAVKWINAQAKLLLKLAKQGSQNSLASKR